MPASNTNRPRTSGGANASPLQIKCWKFQGLHSSRDCTNKTKGVLHNLQEDPMVEDMASTLRIYAALVGRQVDHQATMVEIEGKVSNNSILIWIDPRACWSYVSSNIVETCKLDKVKHEKSWLVWLATSTKRKVSRIVRDCEVNMNGFPAKIDLNILPLGSYNVIIIMDWLEQHHAILDFLNKSIFCTDIEGNQTKIQGLLKKVSVR